MTNAIDTLRSKNWIDAQTKAVIVTKVYLTKNLGTMQIILVILEVFLDHVTRSADSFVINPMLSTTEEICYVVITLLATVAMCVLSVLDLQDKILYATRMEKLRSKLRNKFIQKIYEAEEKYNSEEEARHNRIGSVSNNSIEPDEAN
eukprot:CAMPEP_0197009898 /NCGR_PEP_ID=MMETSP1380-20130617/51972_1 /TAXON_ID=5936 /ORGANISM="Euplotes crassus, Strain CT5" /LENGTH=146 /DNA_ID=CAMNT_0042431457 /DNA_START=211 /DNA_END=648 /DNA_ORIENTATION=-